MKYGKQIATIIEYGLQQETGKLREAVENLSSSLNEDGDHNQAKFFQRMVEEGYNPIRLRLRLWEEGKKKRRGL